MHVYLLQCYGPKVTLMKADDALCGEAILGWLIAISAGMALQHCGRGSILTLCHGGRAGPAISAVAGLLEWAAAMFAVDCNAAVGDNNHSSKPLHQ